MDRGHIADDGAALRLLIVLLEQRRQFRVHPGQLLLVDADNEGHQSEDELPLTLFGADQSPAGHSLECAVGCVGVHPGAGGNVGGRLAGQPHHPGQRCLLRREDLRQQPQFHAALGGGEAVGDGVQSLGQFTVDVLRHCLFSFRYNVV